MKHAAVAVVLSSLAIALAGTAAAAIEVTLECGTCTVAPDPAVLPVGQTLEFACDASCSVGCRFASFGGITGVTPFDVTVAPSFSSAPLGPATVADESTFYQATEQDGTQDCSIGVSGTLLTTSASVPGLAHWGLIGLASLLVVAGVYALHERRVSA